MELCLDGARELNFTISCTASGVIASQGVVAAVMFKARMPGSLGKVAPYCVKLTGGPRMLAPTDNDEFIRKAS